MCEGRVRFAPVYVHERETIGGEPQEYTLAACTGCGEPALFFRTDVIFQEEFLEIEEPGFERLWERSPRALDFSVPESVRLPYLEACEAELMNLPTASAVMVGRALEAVCDDLSTGNKGIYETLRTLRDQGKLSHEMFAWAEHLRILRNLAAHSTERMIDPVELESALEFLEALLIIIYRIRPRFGDVPPSGA